MLFVGGMFLVAGFLRLGFIAQFLSRPVVEAFVFGLAIFVAVKQLPKLLGISSGVGETSGATLLLGGAALALLFGAANAGSAFVGGLAAGGSLSQSAVNEGAGARSEASALVAAALMVVTVLVLTPLFTDLPEAVLAALIIHAVSHLWKVREFERYYAERRIEFLLALATLVRDRVKYLVGASDPLPRAVILDIGVNDELDITSAEMLEQLMDALRAAAPRSTSSPLTHRALAPLVRLGGRKS